jgi:cytochrome P450
MTIEDQDRIAVAKGLDWHDPVFRTETEFEVYETLRGLPPQRSDATGEWFFLDYELCREAFQRADVFSNDWLVGENRLGMASVFPENTDGEVQREYRRLLDPLFNPQKMTELEEDIRDYARQLLEPIAAKGSAELVAEFTMPFPTIIFCRLMGWPLEDHPRLMRWKDVYMNGMTPFVAAQLGIQEVDEHGRPDPMVLYGIIGSAATEIIDYCRDILDARRADPRDDVMTALVQLRRADGTPLEEDELIRIVFNLFLGGLDTVTGMLSFMIKHFAEHADDRRAFMAIMDDPDKIGPAIEELVRFHSIVSIPRRVVQACPFHGADLQEGDLVQVVTTAADRDEARFPAADSIDYDRSPNPHLGFGLGLHRCLGIHLARRELRIGLQELHRILPDYHLDADDAPVIGSGGVRGLFTLPVVVGKA